MLGNHHLRCDLTRLVVRANPGREHRIPAPEWLVPERRRPREDPVLDHVVVAAPHAIDEHIDGLDARADVLESRSHRSVVAMVATKRRHVAVGGHEFGRGSACHKHGSASGRQFMGDAAADAVCPAGHHGDSPVQALAVDVHGLSVLTVGPSVLEEWNGLPGHRRRVGPESSTTSTAMTW